MISDIERRTGLALLCVCHKVSMESESLYSSSPSSQYSTEDTTWETCQGTQPYLFEPYNSEASSDMDSTNESDDEQFEQLQNTGW